MLLWLKRRYIWGREREWWKLGMNIQKRLAFFLSDSITKTFLSISELWKQQCSCSFFWWCVLYIAQLSFKHISNEGVEIYKYKNLKYRVHPITHQECMTFSLKMLIQVFAILYSCFKTLKSLRYPPTSDTKIPLFLHTLIGMIRRVWPPEVFRKFWVPNCQPLWAAQRSPNIFALNFLFRQEEFVGTKMKYPYFK